MNVTMLDRLRKRRRYPVPEAGEALFVRCMTRGEIRRMSELPPELRDNFFFGCVLTDEEAGSVFPQNEGESDADFATRLKQPIEEIGTDTLNLLGAAVTKLSQAPPLETLEKN